jgi:DTW domain-containing protein YfiP
MSAPKSRLNMPPPEPGRYREYCYVCRRVKTNCLCGVIKPFDTRLRVVILMHCKEAREEKLGTARLARLCLTNADLFVGYDFTEDERVNSLLRDPAYAPLVLYPGPTARGFAALGPEELPPGRTPLVFVIDGTWHCAKSLLFRSRNLHGLPRLSFSGDYRSRFAIKRQPVAHCVSTIEAIYYLLKEAEAAGHEKLEGRAEVLPEVLRRLVETQQRYAREIRHRREDHSRR